MAQQGSIDVTTSVDLQEVDNAVNQAQKEISQRYDFKGSVAAIELKRVEGKLALTAEKAIANAKAINDQVDAIASTIRTRLSRTRVA